MKRIFLGAVCLFSTFLIGYLSGSMHTYDDSYHERMKTRYDQSETFESK